MNKLSMHTPSLADSNFSVLAGLFPNAVTETINENGAIVRAIDADVLAQEINTHVVSGREERYQFTWPDKKNSVLLANAPIAAALRPCREESVDFDNTENLYIEGDNLDVLKLLRETYLNRVKMIYIDPPYNTGGDFIYEDDFAESAEEFLRRDEQYDEQGNRLTPNLNSNGRFHTAWLNMVYARLRVARDLLTDDGVICIQIDDNECVNLKKVLDEIYGETNFLTTICVKMSHLSGMKMSHKDKKVPKIKEYIHIYAKNITMLTINPVYIPGKWDDVFDRYSQFIENPEAPVSSWRYINVNKKMNELGIDRIDDKDNFRNSNASRIFRTAVNDSLSSLPKDNIFREITTATGMKKIALNREEVLFASNKMVDFSGKLQPAETIGDIWTDIGINNLHNEGDVQFQNGKKPIKLLQRLLSMFSINDSLVLDFFSGSATTAHAVVQQNAEDGGKRKYIMVQIPELTHESSDAYKEGYKNICEIGKERIRRVGPKIKGESPMTTQDLDIGFRVLKLDSSNMKEVYYTPDEYAQMGFNLEGFMDNIKPDRSYEDLLFQVMLDLGVPLSSKIKKQGDVFYVNDNYLIACFGKVDTSLITEIAKQQPYYAVFRDSSFINDSAMVNFEQVFATYSPNTIRRVL